MSTLNRSFTTYVPNDNTTYAIPVQFGDVYNLCPAITPLRKGLLGWVDQAAGEYRIAVVEDFDDIFIDNIVPSGDERVVYATSGNETISTGCIWTWEGSLYAFVSYYDDPAGDGYIQCYVADDIEDPTSWSIRGTVKSHTSPTSFSAPLTVREMGPPTVTDTGRWVLPSHSWITFAGTALADSLGIFYSDDDGATWSNPVNSRRAPLFGGSAGPQSTTIAYQPASDDLWMGSIIGSVAQWRPYSSSDDGSNWSDNEQATGGFNPYFYMDDGTTMYAGLIDSGVTGFMRLYAVDDPTDPSTWTSLGMNGIQSDGYVNDDGFQIIPFIYLGELLGVGFTARDRIAYTPLCTQVFPDPLFIPYKDRLERLAQDVTDASIVQAQDREFDNWKTVERWAHDWADTALAPERCRLFIPYKDHSREPPAISAAQSFDNWKAVERWAYLMASDCSCNCGGTAPEKCFLFVPFKAHLVDVDLIDRPQLDTAAAQEFDNFKTLERWANRYAAGECGCTG